MKYSWKTIFYLSIAFISGFALSGCASAPEITDKTPIQDIKSAPEWVRKCSGAFGGDTGKVIYGCGSASLKNVPLKRTAANNRARNEVAKLIKLYTASLMKDYQSEIVAGDPEAVSWENYVQEVQKTVTSATLTGVEIVDHWEHPASGEFFALARLDLEAFKNNIEEARKINDSVRKLIQENSERLHEQLNKEEEKLKIR